MNDFNEYCLDLGRRAKRAAAELAVVSGAQKQAVASPLRTAFSNERSACLGRSQSAGHRRRAGLRTVGCGRRPAAPHPVQRVAEMAKAPGAKWPPSPNRSARSSRPLSGPTAWRCRRCGWPLGVIFFIYESRPNVTADAAALCVKAGNAVILRGGKERPPTPTRPSPKSWPKRPPTPDCPPMPCSWSERPTGPPWAICFACRSTSIFAFRVAARA